MVMVKVKVKVMKDDWRAKENTVVIQSRSPSHLEERRRRNSQVEVEEQRKEEEREGREAP